MKLVSGLIVVLTMSLVAGASSAQDQSAPSKKNGTSFEGAYAGFGIGVATASGETDYPLLSGGTTYAPYDPSNGNAVSGFAGYNFVRGDIVYGAEINLVNLQQLIQADPVEHREIMDFADVRARVGRQFDTWMVYGALGWSWAKFRVHPGTFFADRPNQTTLTGYNLGLGVEKNLSEQWFLGGEVTYRDLNGRFGEATRDTNVDLSTLSFRLAYRF